MTSAPPATTASPAAQVASRMLLQLPAAASSAEVLGHDVVFVVLLQPVSAPLKAPATAAATSRVDSVCVCPAWRDSAVTLVRTVPTASPAAEVNACCETFLLYWRATIGSKL